MLVATCNVNGIRAAVRKGFSAWLAETSLDVLLLQEVRAPEDLLPELIGDSYQVFAHASALAGRAGVAIALQKKYAAGEVQIGLPAAAGGSAEPDVDTGRWLEVDVPELETTFVSAYLHSGVADNPEKMQAKYAHLDKVSTRLEQIPAAPRQKHILVAGDFNIVYGEKDIKNWKSNHNKTSGVLDKEIAYLHKWFGEFGYVDVQRHLAGDIQGPYTWWSQRGKAFDNDAGWRIDYQMSDADLAARAVMQRVDRAPSYAERFSDHAPLVIEYK